MTKITVAKICALPEQSEREEKSFLELLKELNINRHHPGVTIRDIKDYLENNVSLIENWLLYSMNKRVTDSWYLIKEARASYIVGYLFKDARKKEFQYKDPAQACAVFIYNELFEVKPDSVKHS